MWGELARGSEHDGQGRERACQRARAELDRCVAAAGGVLRAAVLARE